MLSEDEDSAEEEFDAEESPEDWTLDELAEPLDELDEVCELALVEELDVLALLLEELDAGPA